MSSLGGYCDDPFWDSSLTLNGSWPQFTQCFQDTALVWGPCGFLWLSAPLYTWFLASSSTQLARNTYSKLFLAKLFSAVCLSILYAFELVHISGHSSSHDVAQSSIVASAVSLVTVLLALSFVAAEGRKRFGTSGVLSIFWILLLICNIIPFYTHIELQTYKDDLFSFVVFYITYFFIFVEFLLYGFGEEPAPSVIPNKKPNPEAAASFVSRLTFSWISYLIRKGYQSPLVESSMPQLNTRDQSAFAVPRFLTRWTKAVLQGRARQKQNVSQESSEVSPLLGNPVGRSYSDSADSSHSAESGKKPKKSGPSLLYVLLKTYWTDLLLSQVWKLFYDVLLLCSPLILGELVAFVQNATETPWKGYVLALGLFSCTALQSLLFHQVMQLSLTLGLRIRAALISTIFRKSLTMDNGARKDSNSGEVVNLMSVDADHIQDMMQYLWALWSSPLQLIVSLYLLYQRVGNSMFAGLAFLLLLVPVNGYMTSKIQALEGKMLAYKDERMKTMNELLNGIKIIKLFAWEKSFEKKVLAIRNNELHILYRFGILEAIFSFSWTVAPFVMMLLMFLTYVYVSPDHYLDSQTAFVAMSLINIMKFAFTFAPLIFTDAVKAVISAKRIQRYLHHDDLDETNVSNDAETDESIVITNGHFRWNSDMAETLKNINLKVSDASLVAVVGTVGSGKSSLLSAMLGEMDKLEGTVVLRGSKSYVPQQAWIQNNTLRGNILFGKDYDPVLYQRCIEACALTADLQMLPEGDLTEIGEKGINLSGGQKQRVSLARAVYSQSDIYLMDDPLSAVDSHVGRHIFNEVLSDSGMLAGKVVVLVTHGLHWLPHTDQVIVMANGCISESGHYEQLLSHQGDFAQLVTSFILESEEDQLENSTDEFQELKERVLRTLSQSEDEWGTPSQGILRQLSLSSKHQTEKKDKAKGKDKEEPVGKGDGVLIEEETVELGRVKWAVVKRYGLAIGLVYVVLVAVLYVVNMGAGLGANLWLTEWTDDADLGNFTRLPRNSSERTSRNDFYVGVYSVFGIAQTFAVLITAVIENVRAVNAARIIHGSLLTRILHAPMSFFDTIPIGRIVNRFSRDLNEVDEDLPMTFHQWIDGTLLVLTSIAAIAYGTPIFLIAVVPLGVLFFFIQRYYVATSRQVKRLCSKTQSPVFNHFSETLNGAAVIRAFGAQSRFIHESEKRVDAYQIFEYCNNSSNRWLGIRLEFLSNLVVLIAATMAVVTRDVISPGIMGLMITYALQITEELNWMVRTTSDMEKYIVAVERIQEYSEIDIEAPWDVADEQRPDGWPLDGSVEVDRLCLRYRPGLDLVLKDISFSVRPGEKVGIVGRTGAGKSSLTLALFRLVEASSGSIHIDGVDISTLGLHDLRNKITILPQDPVIFAGTLRENLDPFNDYTEEDLLTVVKHCHLQSFVDSLSNKLGYECGEGGENLSFGQRQLLCLGRALLRKAKILVLDEATAAVDMETDELLQKTIRTEFKECTVLTIAHRLNTVMDYDRILVLENGEVSEMDSPANLLKNPDGLFYSMAKAANLVV